MSNEITRYQNSLARFQPTTLDEIITLSKLFAESGLFSADNARQSAAQLAVKILAGQELGFTPFAAANGMQIIKGKCAPSANLMAALVKASGRYNYRVTEMTDAKVSIDFFEQGKPVGTSTFTAQDAAKAGTQNMQKFARNMLFARAISNGVRWYCPDLSNGVAMYTPEELGATVDYETGEILETVQPNAMPMLTERHENPVPPTANAAEPPIVAPIVETNDLTGIIDSFNKQPSEAWQWAAGNKYTENEHSARNRWTAIVKEKGGYTPAKFNEIAAAYVAHYMSKKEAA